MRTASDRYTAAMPTRITPVLELIGYRGATVTGPIPYTPSWSVTSEDGDDGGTLRVDVPAVPPWIPSGDPYHPLANNGQRIRVALGVRHPDGDEMMPVGEFRITRATPTDDVIQVEAVGLISLLRRARLLAPWSSAGRTRAAAIRRLCQGHIPVDITVTDEAMAKGSWDRERLEAIDDILDAWPARRDIDSSGVLVISEAWGDTIGAAEVTITDGPGGTLTDTTPPDDDSDPFNAFVVSTVPDSDEEPVTESWAMRDGPMAWGGPYGYNPGFFSSPLLPNDRARLRQVAVEQTMKEARRGLKIGFSATPDYRLEVGDIVHLIDSIKAVDVTGRLVQVTHSRTATTGAVAT